MQYSSSYWVQQAARSDFLTFLDMSFRIQHPGTRFLPGKHLDILAFALEDIASGKHTRLIINMPPRFLKTFTVCSAWPAWMLGKDPALKFLTASYSESLATRAAQDMRSLIEHPAYRALFPRTQLVKGDNRKDAYHTTFRGGRRSLSTGGAVTGEGGDILIIDDPLNAMDARMQKKRDYANQWFEQAFLSRLNCPTGGAVIVVMQRLHPQDLTGHLLEHHAGHWQHVCLPAQAEQHRVFYPDQPKRTRTWEQSEPLHASRADTDVLKRIREAIGVSAYDAQYLQRPHSVGGSLVKDTNISVLSAKESQAVLHDISAYRIIQSWDCAAKTGDYCDYSVCITLAVSASCYYIIDVFRDKIDYSALKHNVRALASAFSPDIILIEDKSAGQALLQELRGVLPLKGVIPKTDKVTRFLKISGLFETHAVSILHRACKTGALRDELLNFPDGAHDDQVDALTQGLEYASKEYRQHRQHIRISRT